LANQTSYKKSFGAARQQWFDRINPNPILSSATLF